MKATNKINTLTLIKYKVQDPINIIVIVIVIVITAYGIRDLWDTRCGTESLLVAAFHLAGDGGSADIPVTELAVE